MLHWFSNRDVKTSALTIYDTIRKFELYEA